MANRNYAENLIGNWETNQYEPQRQVVRDVYRTNWNKLTSDLNTLKDQLNRNFERAKITYGDTLGQTTNDSFSRMYNVENNLANRGLTGSGLINRYNQSDIAKKGDETNTALSKLLNTITLLNLFLNSGVNIFLTSSVILSLVTCLDPKPIRLLFTVLAPALDVIIKMTFLKSVFLP